MKILVEVKDEKADFIMELLNSFSFVKTEPAEPSAYKKEVLDGLREAVEEVNQIMAGKKKNKMKTLDQLLDEL